MGITKAIRARTHWLWLGASLALFLVMALVPLLVPTPIVSAGQPRVRVTALPAASCILLPLAAVVPLLALRAFRRGAAAGGGLAHCLRPLVFLPWGFLGFLLPWDVPGWPANLLFFLPVGLAATAAWRAVERLRPAVEAWPPRRVALALFLGLGLVYTLAGTAISLALGEHATADESHYLIQADSLYRDHDLDIRNNFGFDVDAAIAERARRLGYPPGQEAAALQRAEELVRAHLHVSPHRPDRWRSWHPYGLSVLLAPAMPFGVPGRHLVVGLLSSAACALAFLLCVQLGQGRWASALVALLLGCSSFWLLYAARCLAETAGAAALALAVYGASLLPGRPWRATLLTAVACAALPFLHPRFALFAGWAAVWFAFCWWRGASPRARRRALWAAAAGVALLAAAVAAWGVTRLVRLISAYPLGGLFFVRPKGAWLVLISERGLLYGLPFAAFLLPALVWALAADRRNRWLHAAVLAALVGFLIVFGMADNWDGGPMLAGRYLVFLVPLLLPAAAFALERSPAFGRWWVVALVLAGTALFAMGLASLDSVGGLWVRDPLLGVRRGLPRFRELFDPYRHGLRPADHAFALLLCAFTAFVTLRARRSRPALVAACAAFVALAVTLEVRLGRSVKPCTPSAVEEILAQAPAAFTTVEAPEPVRLARLANRMDRAPALQLTTEDLGTLHEGWRYSQPRVDANGWDDPALRWLTLAPPFRPGAWGPRLFEVGGTRAGTGTVYVAVREGAYTRLYTNLAVRADGRFHDSFVVPCWGVLGDVYLLARVQGGPATVSFRDLTWTPLVRGARVQWPESVTPAEAARAAAAKPFDSVSAPPGL